VSDIEKAQPETEPSEDEDGESGDGAASCGISDRKLRLIYKAIGSGVHPEVAGQGVGILTEEFQELIAKSTWLKRRILRCYARYEWSRASIVDRSHDPRVAIAYLERCRSRWTQKVNVDLKVHAKRAFERLERELLTRGKEKMFTGEQAYDLVLQCFNSEGAENVFE
jgi:hypothetical protein